MVVVVVGHYLKPGIPLTTSGNARWISLPASLFFLRK